MLTVLHEKKKTCTNYLINKMQVVLKYIYLKKKSVNKSVIVTRAWSSLKRTRWTFFPKGSGKMQCIRKATISQ